MVHRLTVMVHRLRRVVTVPALVLVLVAVAAGCARKDAVGDGTSGIFATTAPPFTAPAGSGGVPGQLSGRLRVVNLLAAPDGTRPAIEVWIKPRGDRPGTTLVKDIAYGTASDYVLVPRDSQAAVYLSGRPPPDGAVADLSAVGPGEQATDVVEFVLGVVARSTLLERSPDASRALVAPPAGAGLVVLDASALPRAAGGDPQSFYAGGPVGTGCLAQQRVAITGGAPGLLGGQDQTQHYLQAGTVPVNLHGMQDRRCEEAPLAGPFPVTVTDGSAQLVLFHDEGSGIGTLILPIALA